MSNIVLFKKNELTELSDYIPDDVERGLDAKTYSVRYGGLFNNYKKIDNYGKDSPLTDENISIANDLYILKKETIEEYSNAQSQLEGILKRKSPILIHKFIGGFIGGAIGSVALITSVFTGGIAGGLIGFAAYYGSLQLGSKIGQKVENNVKKKQFPTAQELMTARTQYIKAVNRVLMDYEGNRLESFPLKRNDIILLEPKYGGGLSNAIDKFSDWIYKLEQVKMHADSITSPLFYEKLLELEHEKIKNE